MTIKVLVVDDSAMMRALLTHRLEREPDIEVVGTSSDAQEARQHIKALDPDVITLDIEMPGMDGLSFLEKIMQLRPTPVILVSGATERGAAATVRGLQLGAVGCYPKSQLNRVSGQGECTALAEMVRDAANARMHGAAPARSAYSHARSHSHARPAPGAATTLARPVPSEPALIVVGASTGGVEALHVLLGSFPADCPPTLVVQHINACFAGAIASSLNSAVAPSVMLAESDLVLKRGQVLLAPGGDRHLMVARAGPDKMRCVLRTGDPVSGHRPSVDCLFRSTAETMSAGGDRVLGILLTGMGQDGAQGLMALASIGARTIAQDEASCVVFGMPRAAIELGAAGSVLPLARIAPAIFAR